MRCYNDSGALTWCASSPTTGQGTCAGRLRWAWRWLAASFILWSLPAIATTLSWDASTGTNVQYLLYRSVGTAPFDLLLSTLGTTATVTPDAMQPTRYFVTAYSTNYAKPESDPSNILTLAPSSPTLPGLSFEAEAGAITAPFYALNGSVKQDVQTTAAADGGRLSFQFAITNAGLYTVTALVSAPDGGSDSFFVNVDTEPGDQQVWSIPNTVGFEWRGVRYARETNDHQFALTAMAHVLIFRGREANCAIDKVTIAPVAVPVPPQPIPGPPPAPQNLRAVQVTGKRLDLAWNSVLDAATEVERSVNASAFAFIERVAPGTLHTTTTVNKNQNYVFRCRAVNAQGVSPYSNNAMVSTR